MNEDVFYKRLVERYLDKKLTSEELEVFISLYNEVKLDNEFNSALHLAEEDFLNENFIPETATRKLWIRPALIAASLAIVCLGSWYSIRSSQKPYSAASITYAKNTIKTGHEGATITLANGKSIELSSAQRGVKIAKESIVYIDGSLVNTDHVELPQKVATAITASTKPGQTYAFILQDGTKVWLNAASAIQFPSTFNQLKNRIVTLQGEAYFEVAKDKNHPFIVKTPKQGNLPEQKITVLGTHFNVNAYANEHRIKTTLLEGRVEVQDAVLNINQQSILTERNTLAIIDVNAAMAIDWKNGNFIFQGESIESIMKRVERWYNVEVIYNSPSIKARTFTGEISRYENITELLKILQRTGKVSFEIQSNKIIVGG